MLYFYAPTLFKCFLALIMMCNNEILLVMISVLYYVLVQLRLKATEDRCWYA